jgi:hypothetical protein
MSILIGFQKIAAFYHGLDRSLFITFRAGSHMSQEKQKETLNDPNWIELMESFIGLNFWRRGEYEINFTAEVNQKTRSLAKLTFSVDDESIQTIRPNPYTIARMYVFFPNAAQLQNAVRPVTKIE